MLLQGTKSSKKKKQAKLKRVMATVKKQARKENSNPHDSFAAVQLLNDPQVCCSLFASCRMFLAASDREHKLCPPLYVVSSPDMSTLANLYADACMCLAKQKQKHQQWWPQLWEKPGWLNCVAAAIDCPKPTACLLL